MWEYDGSMTRLVMSLLMNGLAVWVAAMVVPGVRVESFVTAMVVAILLTGVNWFVKPILIILTLPVTILTLGLFLLVLNGLMVLLVSALVPGFVVAGWWAGFWFSVVLWLVNMVLGALTKEKD